MEERPRNLREMLSEAKDTSELMVDLAYASVYFDDPDMAEEIGELEEDMSALVQAMRTVCVLAVRNPREAVEMSSVLQVISAIERIANSAVDISRIVTRKLGIPAELIADLSEAEEVSHVQFYPDGRCDVVTIELTGPQGDILQVTSPSASQRFRVVSPAEDERQ